MEKSEMTDALGNPIVEGEMYAYSANQNGIWHTTFGRVDGFTKERVRLRDCWSRRGAYGDLGEWQSVKRAVSVYGACLFRVEEAIVTATQAHSRSSEININQ